MARLDEIVEILDNQRVPISAKERAKRPGNIPYYGATGQVGWIDRPLFSEELALLGEDGVQFFDRSKPKAYRISGPTWVNNHAHVLRAREDVTPTRFVVHYLNSFNYEGYANGTTRLKLTKASMSSIPVPLPPLAEQHRIVEALEDHLSRLDAACTALRGSLARSSHLRQSTIRRALRGEGLPPPNRGDAAEEFHPRSRLAPHEHPWHVPDGWLWTTVGSIFNVYVGTTPSRKVPELWSGAIPWVSSGEVSFGRISSTREHISEEAVGNRRTRLHPPGTVMIAMIGEGKTRGQVAILDIEATHNQNCASIRVSETRILPEYVYLVLEERYQQSRSSSSGGNQPALNKSKVEAIPVPLPPLATQQQIVAQIAEFSQASDRVRRELERTLKRAAHLRQALLARAYSGKLVAQDPADEPASVLLDRIRAEREAQGGKVKRGTRRPRKAAEVAPPPAPASTPSPASAVQQELPL